MDVNRMNRVFCLGVLVLCQTAFLTTGCRKNTFQPPKDGLYDLRARPHVTGDVVEFQSTLKITSGEMIFTEGDQLTNVPADFSVRSRSEVEIVSAGGGQVTGFREKILEGTTDVRITVGGNVVSNSKRNKLAGQTVLHTLKGGRWERTLESGSTDPVLLRELAELETPEVTGDVYPRERVKVGHAWKLSGDTLRDFVDTTAKSVTGTVWHEFESVGEHGGELCASIVVTVDVEIRTVDDEGADAIRRLKWSGMTMRSLAKGVDVSGSLRGYIELLGSNVDEGVKGDFKVRGPFVLDGTARLLKEGS